MTTTTSTACSTRDCPNPATAVVPAHDYDSAPINDYGYARPVCGFCQNALFAQLTAWYWDVI
ncbi:hypothetical protein [Nocardia sp. NPDC004860]|uniref:hypothetical protein n=1 Tax=Nocardia sp. NPDC004860 TaxID=3154557 RepID=UPI0033A63E8F